MVKPSRPRRNPVNKSSTKNIVQKGGSLLSTTSTKTKFGITFSKSLLSLLGAFVAGIFLMFVLSKMKHQHYHMGSIGSHISIDVLDNPSPPKNGWLGSITGMFTKPSSGYTNNPKDLLFNPNAPPLKENVYLTETGPQVSSTSTWDLRGDINIGSGSRDRRAPVIGPEMNISAFNKPHRVPINQSTNHLSREYLQVGFLKRSNPISRQTTETRRPDPLETSILPIFGRPLETNRQKWQYYTMTNSNNMVKLPIVHKRKVCSGEYGCDELFSGEMVYVQGIDDQYTVNIYENEQPRYIPSL